MRRAVLSVCLFAVLALLAPPGASAIVGGDPDEERHPYVGALVTEGPDGVKRLICSGFLVAEDVFVTAGHCVVDEPARLWVAFDEFVGAPEVGPEVTLHAGTAHLHPDYTKAKSDMRDLAVVVLDEGIDLEKYARLPTRDRLDDLAAKELLDDQRYKLVGYGREGHGPGGFFGGGSRMVGVGVFKGLAPAWLKLSQRASHGEEGTCNGDSGGPVLLNTTRLAIGVISLGDSACKSTNTTYRLDTLNARRFLNDFVEIP